MSITLSKARGIRLAVLAVLAALACAAVAAQAQAQTPAAPKKLAMAATCLTKPGYQAEFTNDVLRCVKHEEAEVDKIKCPAQFPQYVARGLGVAGSDQPAVDRDLCARAAVNISSSGILQFFRENTDYVFVPPNGVRNGVSFLARHPDATAADGWVLKSNATLNLIDRYRRDARSTLTTPGLEPIAGGPEESPPVVGDTIIVLDNCNLGSSTTIDCGPLVASCSGLVGFYSVYVDGYLTCQKRVFVLDPYLRAVFHYKTPRWVQP